MTIRPSPDSHEAWRRELAATPACVPVERMGEALTAAEREHISHCARCEAEHALWESFLDDTPAAGEGAAVQWIAAEVARRRAGPPAPALRPGKWSWWLGALRPQTLAAAATIVIGVVTTAYLVQDREPPVVAPTAAPNVYRSERLEVIAPTGDFPTPPTVFLWMAAPGAERYDVVVLEVDRTILWRASTEAPRIELPPEVIAQFVPGKTVLWEVTARGRDATTLAQSGTQRFRVVVKPRQRVSP